MPRKHTKKAHRYDEDEIALRVEKERVRLGVQVKDLCSAAKLPLPSWYKKSRRSGSSFTIAELSAIADALDAPPGWPFIEWEMAEAMRRANQR